VQIYLAEVVNKVPPLSKDEEIRCVQQLRAGDDEQAESAERRLVEANLRLVVSIAERYRNHGPVHILDLIVKGNESLQQAVQTLSNSSEANFATYAAHHIELAIAEAARSTPEHPLPVHRKPQ
jgi:RNA polymerase primary sigma factor